MSQETAGARQQDMHKNSAAFLKQSVLKYRTTTTLIFLVCLCVLCVHWPALSSKALPIDDSMYLTENLLVQNPGFSSAWRFLTEVLEPSSVRGYYQPLTMISIMIDYALGGNEINLRPFRRTSLALHIVNTGLIIVLLYQLFGQIWIASCLGLLFGLHPMTVETIPWVGERKTLLSAFFALWSLILYLSYTRKNSWRHYVGSLGMYILAVMSKPISLPLPLLMIIMDYWPLSRLSLKTVYEKMRFFVVAGVFAVITYISQSRTAGVKLPGEYGFERIPLILCHNIIFYPFKMLWPVNLTSYYPYPKPFGLLSPPVLAGVIGTCILLFLLFISKRRTRALITGWLFFFVAILPTMQLIGFSDIIASDKFAYLPSLGFLMILCYFLTRFCRPHCLKKVKIRYISIAVIILLAASAEAIATRKYLVHWRDSLSFYKHMITVAPDSTVAHNNYGNALLKSGSPDDAITHYHQAIKNDLHNALAYFNLGNAYRTQGKFDEAIRSYRKAIEIDANFPNSYNNLGTIFAKQGKLDQAIDCFRGALKVNPNFAPAHFNLEKALKIKNPLTK